MLQQVRVALKQLPEGNLICAKNANHFKWYLSNGSTPIYLPKKEVSKARKLALRKYYLFQEQEILYNLKTLEQCLSRYQKRPHKSTDLLSTESSYYHLLKSCFKGKTDLFEWASEPYNTNPFLKEKCIHTCLSGHLVRSKSEVIIANALFLNQIPFRYECELVGDDMIFYPDFTIRHPNTGETIYWEHFGMMDNEKYRDKAYNKMKVYGNNNIYPAINLIVTFETAAHPISSLQVEKKIKEFLQ